MLLGYCEVYSHSFGCFFDDWSESSCNIRSEETKVPPERKFQGAKLLGTFAAEERKFHRSECSTERKVSLWTFRSQERKCRETKSPSFIWLVFESSLVVSSRGTGKTRIAECIKSRTCKMRNSACVKVPHFTRSRLSAFRILPVPVLELPCGAY